MREGKQSGRTPRRAASLCEEWKALWRDSDTVPEAGMVNKELNNKEIYGKEKSNAGFRDTSRSH